MLKKTGRSKENASSCFYAKNRRFQGKIAKNMRFSQHFYPVSSSS
jgi:hypothetical protein